MIKMLIKLKDKTIFINKKKIVKVKVKKIKLKYIYHFDRT